MRSSCSGSLHVSLSGEDNLFERCQDPIWLKHDLPTTARLGARRIPWTVRSSYSGGLHCSLFGEDNLFELCHYQMWLKHCPQLLFWETGEAKDSAEFIQWSSPHQPLWSEKLAWTLLVSSVAKTIFAHNCCKFWEHRKCSGQCVVHTVEVSTSASLGRTTCLNFASIQCG